MILPRFLSKATIMLIHQQQIARFGGAQGIRDEGLLDSALGSAQHCWHYTGDMHQTAAQYCVSLSRNHPFIDGNKRVAAAAMLIFLALNHITINITSEQLYDWTIATATGELARDDLAEYLRNASSE